MTAPFSVRLRCQPHPFVSLLVMDLACSYTDGSTCSNSWHFKYVYSILRAISSEAQHHASSETFLSSRWGTDDVLSGLPSAVAYVIVSFIITLGSLIYLGYRTINRTRLESDIELPFDPYLKSKNISLDASLIAATEPSFKHTTILSRAYCASKPCSNGESQWSSGPQVSGLVSQPARAGFVYGEMSCYPMDFQNGCSTPNRLWKNSKHVSTPPTYLQSEGTTATAVEKEAHSNVSRIV